MKKNFFMNWIKNKKCEIWLIKWCLDFIRKPIFVKISLKTEIGKFYF